MDSPNPDSVSPTDEALMEAYASSGSEGAFRALYDRYEGRMFSFF